MILLQLFYEFFKTGLFSIGGGMATIPFLQHMGEETGWFTNQDLTTMIAVSESTPGPLGVNMATYVGYETAGVPGALLATLGVITPGIIIILVIASFLSKFRNNRSVEAVFSVLALHTGYVPGTINYETPDPECDLNCMTDGAKKLDPQYALSNSFGFGGTNGSILFKKFTA